MVVDVPAGGDPDGPEERETVTAIAGHPLTDPPGRGGPAQRRRDPRRTRSTAPTAPVPMLRPEPRALLLDGWGNLIFVLALGGAGPRALRPPPGRAGHGGAAGRRGGPARQHPGRGRRAARARPGHRRSAAVAVPPVHGRGLRWSGWGGMRGHDAAAGTQTIPGCAAAPRRRAARPRTPVRPWLLGFWVLGVVLAVPTTTGRFALVSVGTIGRRRGHPADRDRRRRRRRTEPRHRRLRARLRLAGASAVPWPSGLGLVGWLLPELVTGRQLLPGGAIGLAGLPVRGRPGRGAAPAPALRHRAAGQPVAGLRHPAGRPGRRVRRAGRAPRGGPRPLRRGGGRAGRRGGRPGPRPAARARLPDGEPADVRPPRRPGPGAQRPRQSAAGGDAARRRAARGRGGGGGLAAGALRRRGPGRRRGRVPARRRARPGGRPGARDAAGPPRRDRRPAAGLRPGPGRPAGRHRPGPDRRAGLPGRTRGPGRTAARGPGPLPGRGGRLAGGRAAPAPARPARRPRPVAGRDPAQGRAGRPRRGRRVADPHPAGPDRQRGGVEHRRHPPGGGRAAPAGPGRARAGRGDPGPRRDAGR